MLPKDDTGRSLFGRITEGWRFSHWAGALVVAVLWIIAAYEMVAIQTLNTNAQMRRFTCHSLARVSAGQLSIKGICKDLFCRVAERYRIDEVNNGGRALPQPKHPKDNFT